MSEEIIFSKYKNKGADYHYRQINKKNLMLFNAFFYARCNLLIKLILLISKDLLNKRKKIKILDIGCGDGVLFYLLSKKIKLNNFELYGIDYSEEAINIAKMKNPDVKFYVSNVYELPFEEIFFDIIVSSDVIEHLAKPKQMLKEITRVGKKGASCIISTPIKYTENVLDEMHKHEYFQKEFYNLINSLNAFHNIKIIESHRLLYYLLKHIKIRILSKDVFLFHYLINLISIFINKNPFMRLKRKHDTSQYNYMYAIAKI